MICSLHILWLWIMNNCLLKMPFDLILHRNGTASVVTSIFGGKLQNEVNCLICGTESRKFDPFLGKMISITIETV